MKVAGSILAVKDNYMDYAQLLRYAHVNCLHIDIFQGNSEYRIDDLRKFDDSFLPRDVHLICNALSDDDVQILNDSKISYVSIQYENFLDKKELKKLSRNIRANFGLAYTVNTPLNIIEQNVQYCDHVLFMCSEPGVSGAKFDETNYERISEFHKMHPSLNIHADGGIDDDKAKRLERIGVSMVVSGSYLCKDLRCISDNAFNLKYGIENDCLVTNKMIPYAELPLVRTSDNFMRIINIMNKYRLGVVFVVDNDIFMGIIADGDVRRGFIEYEKDIFEKRAEDLMVINPYKVDEHKIIKDIFHDLLELQKGIDIVPIVSEQLLVGALDLRQGVLF